MAKITISFVNNQYVLKPNLILLRIREEFLKYLDIFNNEQRFTKNITDNL